MVGPYFGMEIRAAHHDDAQAIEDLRVAGWKAGYRGVIDDAYLDGLQGDVEWRRRGIEMPAPFINLVATDGDQILGWISGGPAAAEEPGVNPGSTFDIRACYVHPDHWRTGIGARLMKAILDDIDVRWTSVVVWTLRDTPRSIRFYESCGFVLDGETKGGSRGQDDRATETHEVRLTKAL